EPTEGRTCRDLAATIPEGAALLVASSMPIRELDSHMSSRSGITVFANRGASGIDGLVSTAVGIAAVHSPTYALLGDLAFLHDAGAFLWAAREAPDLVLVIIDNGGGRIFDLLPQVALPEHELLFTTPHRLELARIVNAAGAWHRLVSSAADLAPALEDARVQKGVRVVQVDVDAARNGERHQMIAGAIERAAGAIISAA
ncbi:MAG TPA: thiamine pyrophosphate-binding protein, partial [Candidatus Sulfotelmatobacter sp.]|nr:thiamine pyrophosphate-binding protein [Candidatus Sulfotelmatobacter sp.]